MLQTLHRHARHRIATRSMLSVLAAGAFAIVSPSVAIAQIGGDTGAAGGTATDGAVAGNDFGFVEGVSTEISTTGALGPGNAATLGQAPDAGTAGAGGGGGLGGGFGGLGGGLGGLGGLFGGAFGQGAGTSTTPAIRTRLRSAIETAPLPAGQVQQSASRTLNRLPARAYSPNVRVQVVGRTAILQGSVQSDRDRRMSQLLMRLEPGVSRIQNNLIVQP